MRLITHSGSAAVPAADTTLIRTIARARKWWKHLCGDPTLTVSTIADREHLTRSYVTRIVRLAFLSPDVLNAILEGEAPAHLTTDRLTLPEAVPAIWKDQRKLFGIAQLA